MATTELMRTVRIAMAGLLAGWLYATARAGDGGFVSLPSVIVEPPPEWGECPPDDRRLPWFRLFHAQLEPVSAEHGEARGEAWGTIVEWSGGGPIIMIWPSPFEFQSLSIAAAGLASESEYTVIAYRKSDGQRCHLAGFRTDAAGNSPFVLLVRPYWNPEGPIWPADEPVEPPDDPIVWPDDPMVWPDNPDGPIVILPVPCPGEDGAGSGGDWAGELPEPEPEPEPSLPMPVVEVVYLPLPDCVVSIADISEIQVLDAEGRVVLSGTLAEVTPVVFEVALGLGATSCWDAPVVALGEGVSLRAGVETERARRLGQAHRKTLSGYLVEHNVLAPFAPGGRQPKTRLTLRLNEQQDVKAVLWRDGKLKLKSRRPRIPPLSEIRRVDVFDRKGRLLLTRFPRP
jgi:hypothetical protein